MTSKTALSNQGYSIYKNSITESELEVIKNEMTIKPFTCPGYGNEEDVVPYKLYKENTDKIYVPYFYGRNKYGAPQTNKLNKPEPINIGFTAERKMRPYQEEIIKTYLSHAHSIGGGIISVGCGRGKCLAKGTIIPLYNGTSKLVEKLEIGDALIGDDGKPRLILNLGSGISNMFEISGNGNGNHGNHGNHGNDSPHNSYIVNKEHILTFSKQIKDCNNNEKNLIVDIPIMDYLALPDEIKNTYKGIKTPLKHLCSIGNINIDNINIDETNFNIDFEKYTAHEIGYKLGYIILNAAQHNIINLEYILLDHLDKYKKNIKYIIDLYLGLLKRFIIGNNHRATNHRATNNREEYIQGLFPFTLPIPEYDPCFNPVIKLLNLIGITYKYTNLIGQIGQIGQNSSIYNNKYITILYDEYNEATTTHIKITEKGLGEYYGFELNGNGRFILKDRTITHNTVMGLKIAEELKVKTLILVHKEFLMNQWVERINEYLPDARVGYIQGKTLDINHKDIVLAMIQSLSDPRKDKDYPENLFESFGLVIADECHHLAARQFCRSLAKYPFKYTLGLSATPDRADGLARVFKHYLGDIVYKDAEILQSAEDIAIEHIPNSTVELYIYKLAKPSVDMKYNKEEINYKKKPNIVSMKSNVANCLHRTRFLLSFLPRLIAEGRTVLILSCRRVHITQMETLINEMVIELSIPECTVGLYVGGMKQENLDISATKRVIIATYDMAEEAFDCKSLNTLIYATPHKNIKQAVGRILREEKKKRKIIPLIIDIQDVFSTFNSWNKMRMKYYKTEKYPMKTFDVLVKNIKETPEIKFIKDVNFNCKTGKKDKKQSNGVDNGDGNGVCNDTPEDEDGNVDENDNGYDEDGDDKDGDDKDETESYEINF